MRSSLFSSLRTRLMLLIFLAALPVFGLTLYNGFREREAAARAVQEDALRVARLAAFSQARQIEGARQLLTALSHLPEVHSGDWAACSTLFAELVDKFPFYANFGVIALDGDLVCSGVPFSTPVNVADRSYFQRTLQERDFAIGDYQIGRVTGKPSLNFGYPIIDPSDTIQGVVFAALDLSWFNQLALEAQLPPGSTLTVIDPNGTILVRHPDSDQWVGQSLKEEPLGQTILGQGEGTAIVSGLDKAERMYGFTQIDGSPEGENVYVSIGVLKEIAYAGVDRNLIQNIMAVGLVFLLLFILAWFGGDLFIMRPLNALLSVIKRLNTGDLSARVRLRHGPDEFLFLAHAFDEMGESLQMREAEREHTEASLRQSDEKYRSLYASMREGLALHEMLYNEAGEAIDYVIQDINPAYETLTGLTRQQGVGRKASELYGTGAPPYLDIYGAVAASQQSTSFETYFPPLDKHFSISVFSPRKGWFATIFSDISQRKRDEEALKRYNHRLEALHAIDRAILAAQSGETIAGLALQYFLQQVSIPGVSIVAFDFEAREAKVFVAEGNDEDPFPIGTRCSLDEWSENDLAALRTGRIQVIKDATALSPLPPGLRVLQHNGLLSFLRVPLIAQNELIGTLNLAADSSRALITEYQEIAREIADQVAIAMQQARLREHIQRHAAELEQSVAQRTLELQQAKEHVETILNNSSDPIILVSPEKTIQQTNRAFNQLFGFTIDEMFCESLAVLVDRNQIENLTNAVQTVITTRQPSRIELVMQHKDRTLFDADVAFVPVTESEGRESSIICTIRDVTVQKRTEEGLRKALEKEKDLSELKSRFASMVSHDVRVPLTVILSSTEMLRLYYGRLDEAKRIWHFDKIRTQVDRMISLLNDVLTISRDDVGATPFRPMPINLHRFCQGIAEEFQSNTHMKHTLAYSHSDGPTRVLVDEKLLQQAVINLLTNAFKYSPESSIVDFKLSFDKDNAIIRIKDSGIGIPEADLPRLFETFHRAGNVGAIEGTGLGLAIVKRSIDAHGGEISVETKVSVGTTFTIRLPLIP